MRKKILYVVEAMGGGIFSYIVDLANELVESYDIYIAYAVRDQTPLDYRNYFDKRIHLIEIESFTRSINPYKDVKAFIELRRIGKSINPDIIHFHSSKAGAIGRIAFKRKSIPQFYTPHGYSFLMKDCNKLKRALYKTIEICCASKNCMTISCSKGEHLETLKITKNASYVSNGVNISKLQDKINNVLLNEHPFTVFTIGRISFQKNPALFNEIAKLLPNVNFLWIGDGELRNCLTAKNIQVSGWNSRDKVIELAANSDMFILTSLWEGLPISLIEAMYLKKTCAVSNVIGNKDVINNKINGFICESALDFKKAIEYTMRHDNKSLLYTAYDEVLNIYNTKKMAYSYAKIYNEKL